MRARIYDAKLGASQEGSDGHKNLSIDTDQEKIPLMQRMLRHRSSTFSDGMDNAQIISECMGHLYAIDLLDVNGNADASTELPASIHRPRRYHTCSGS